MAFSEDDLKGNIVSEITANPASAVIIRLAEGDSLLTGLYLFQALVNERKMKGIYLSCNANSPYHFLDNYFSAHSIDVSKVTFIDTVSLPMLGKRASGSDNAFFTQGSVTSDAMAVLKELVYSVDGLSFIYLDSLTEMLKFHTEDEIVGFLAELTNFTKKHRMAGLILSFYGEREAELVKSVTSYCNRCIDF